MGKRKKNKGKKLSKAERVARKAAWEAKMRAEKKRDMEERAEALTYAAVVLEDAAPIIERRGLHRGFGFVGDNDSVCTIGAMRLAAGIAKPDGWFDKPKLGGTAEEDYTVAAEQLGAYLAMIMPELYGVKFKSIPTWDKHYATDDAEVIAALQSCAVNMHERAEGLVEQAAAL